MTSVGVGDLVFYEGRVNSQTYIQLIGDSLTRFIKLTFNVNDKFLFMQDNAPPHTSNHATSFFKKNSIPVMKWAESSPDLNPIENIWAIIHDRLTEMRPKNLKELQLMIQQIYHDISELLRACFGMIPGILSCQ